MQTINLLNLLPTLFTIISFIFLTLLLYAHFRTPAVAPRQNSTTSGSGAHRATTNLPPIK